MIVGNTKINTLVLNFLEKTEKWSFNQSNSNKSQKEAGKRRGEVGRRRIQREEGKKRGEERNTSKLVGQTNLSQTRNQELLWTVAFRKVLSITTKLCQSTEKNKLVYKLYDNPL